MRNQEKKKKIKKAIIVWIIILLVLCLLYYITSLLFSKKWDTALTTADENHLLAQRENVTSEEYLKRKNIPVADKATIEAKKKEEVKLESSDISYYEPFILAWIKDKEVWYMFISADLPKESLNQFLSVEWNESVFEKVSKTALEKLKKYESKDLTMFIGWFKYNSSLASKYELVDVFPIKQTNWKKYSNLDPFNKAPFTSYKYNETSIKDLEAKLKDSGQSILTLRGVMPYKKLKTDEALKIIKDTISKKAKQCDEVTRARNFSYVSDINWYSLSGGQDKKCDTVWYVSFTSEGKEYITLVNLSKYFSEEDIQFYHKNIRIPEYQTARSQETMESIYIELKKQRPDLIW